MNFDSTTPAELQNWLAHGFDYWEIANLYHVDEKKVRAKINRKSVTRVGAFGPTEYEALRDLLARVLHKKGRIREMETKEVLHFIYVLDHILKDAA